MKAFSLPLRLDSPRYSIRVDLDGARYEFSFEWNDRAAAWFFDLLDAAGVVLLSSVRVSVGFPFLERFPDSRLPPGLLFAVDTMKTDRDPGLSDFGSRVQLIYTPLAEVPADVQATREGR